MDTTDQKTDQKLVSQSPETLSKMGCSHYFKEEKLIIEPSSEAAYQELTDRWNEALAYAGGKDVIISYRGAEIRWPANMRRP